MRGIVAIASSLALVAVMASAAQADLASDFWARVTDSSVTGNGANAATVGEDIRVVFVTSATIRGNLTTQSSYDGLAASSATTGVLTSGLTVNGGWRSLVTAADSTGLNPVASWVVNDFGTPGAVKVFNTHGDYVGRTDTFFTSSLSSQIKYNESGTDLLADANANTSVWTGTGQLGDPATTKFGGSSGSLLPTHMGNTVTFSGSGPFGTYGNFSLTTNTIGGGDVDFNPNGNSWLENGIYPFRAGTLPGSGIGSSVNVSLPIYAMSGEIVAVPEPSTILMWLGFSGIASMVYWRKRRS